MPSSVVLVHGIRTSATMWRTQVLALERLGHEVIAIDLPGHGSRIGERFSLEAAMDAIDSAVGSAAHPVFVCGFSLGGYLSLHWAGLQPRSITGLMAAGCSTRPFRVVLDGWRAAAAVIHRFPDRGLALNNWAARAAIRDPSLAADVIAGGVALDVMDDTLRELRAVHPLDSLRRISVPLWLVNGSLDHFRIEERRYLAAAPHATLVDIRGANHMVTLTKPAEFTTLLSSALDSVGE